MKVASFVNMKGGVAKTTLAVNVADCIARRNGKRVLVIDIDPQFNATQCLLSGSAYVEGLQSGEHTILNVFDDSPRAVASTVKMPQLKEPVGIKDIRAWKVRNNLYLLPGNLELYRLEMGGGQGRENRLKRFIETLASNDEFDIVIIDTPPTPSAWMASALIASDYFLVPVKPEPLSVTGIDLLMSVVKQITENHALRLDCAGVVLTIAEEQTLVFERAVNFIDNNNYWKGKRFHNFLPKRTAIARMPAQQEMILDSNDHILLRAITSITNEFLKRINADV